MQASDVVITMGCGDACPIYPGKRYEDWKLDDPAGQGVEAVRPIRDEIDRRVRALVADLLASTDRRLREEAAMSETRLDDLPLDQQHLVRDRGRTSPPTSPAPSASRPSSASCSTRSAQLVPTAKVTTFLPVLAEKFARERLRALGRLDGSLAVDAPACCSSACTTPVVRRWPRAGSATSAGTTWWCGPAGPSRGRRSTRWRSRRWPRSASTSPGSSRSRGPRRSCGPPTWWSPWAAATPARSTRARATRTGSSTIPPGMDLDAVRPVRDEIRERVVALMASLGITER